MLLSKLKDQRVINIHIFEKVHENSNGSAYLTDDNDDDDNDKEEDDDGDAKH